MKKFIVKASYTMTEVFEVETHTKEAAIEAVKTGEIDGFPEQEIIPW